MSDETAELLAELKRLKRWIRIGGADARFRESESADPREREADALAGEARRG